MMIDDELSDIYGVEHLLRPCPRTDRVPYWGRETRRYRMWWDFLWDSGIR